ncbi:MAG TPA: PilN domain-containing protein [Bacilli bacterium]|nr:PilN domain-containing protein [Bacilli bacterium]
MEINLLPRRTPLETYRLPILIGAIVLILAALITPVLFYLSLAADIATTQAQLDRAQADKTVMVAERTVSPELRKLQEYQKTIEQLQHQERRYGEMLDRVAAQLSTITVVTEATLEANQRALTMNVQAESIDVIADYAELLRREPWVQDVKITEIDRSDAQTEEETPFSADLTIRLQPIQE